MKKILILVFGISFLLASLDMYVIQKHRENYVKKPNDILMQKKSGMDVIVSEVEIADYYIRNNKIYSF